MWASPANMPAVRGCRYRNRHLRAVPGGIRADLPRDSGGGANPDAAGGKSDPGQVAGAAQSLLDPLNHIQVTVLRRYRQALRDQGADSPEAGTWLRPLLRSINALAAGMRIPGEGGAWSTRVRSLIDLSCA